MGLAAIISHNPHHRYVADHMLSLVEMGITFTNGGQFSCVIHYCHLPVYSAKSEDVSGVVVAGADDS